MNIFKEVLKFNNDAGNPNGLFELSEHQAFLELNMLSEELCELDLAFRGLHEFASKEEQRIAIADALGDIIYVAMGTMAKLGLDYQKIMEAIVESNKTKYQEGILVKNKAGKIQKGDGFKEPNLGFCAAPEDLMNKYFSDYSGFIVNDPSYHL